MTPLQAVIAAAGIVFDVIAGLFILVVAVDVAVTTIRDRRRDRL